MIPAMDELPEGTDRELVESIARQAREAPYCAGIVSLLEDLPSGEVLEVGVRAWELSPMFLIMEFFGLPYSAEVYGELISSVDRRDAGELVIRPERFCGDGRVRAAFVRTLAMGLPEIARWIETRRS